MVDDEQRSIELVDDMREQAERMAVPGLKEEDLVAAAQQIAQDARAYEPLTAQPGEREEWERLREKLAQLESHAHARDFEAMAAHIEEIHPSVHRLVVINRDAARQQAEAIRKIHGQAIALDAAVGLAALALVTGIVVFVLRVVNRQRELIERHIALMAERNRELDAFAGRAAHDLRVPLNPIRGYADLLMTGKESPGSVREMAGRIRKAVDQMTHVVENMLELSRAGSQPSGAASPARVAADVLEELRPQFADTKIITALTDEQVACAPSVLAQLLRNLLGNAAKFRSRQRGLVVAMRAVTKPGEIELILEDNGIGMSDADLQHAFDAHYRGSEHREVPGHGLGLAIVHRTMSALGGSCAVARSSLDGTAVTLRFPRAVVG